MEARSKRAGRQQRLRAEAERMRDAFGLVLILVLLSYVLTSLLADHGWTAVLITATLSATSIVALASSHVDPRFVRAAFWASVVCLISTLISAFTSTYLWLNFSSMVVIVLLAVAMGAVLIRVVTTAGTEVNSRTILGALSVYAVLGLLFTYLYATIGRIEDGPFFEANAHPGGSDFLFFSYTTLTTTGYGDLVPAGQPGRMLAGIEMMLGQIFLVTLVAGLVSLWRPGESLRKRREAKLAATEDSAASEPPRS